MNQQWNSNPTNRPRRNRRKALASCAAAGLAAIISTGLSACTSGKATGPDAPTSVTVGVTTVVKKTLSRQITLSSELVPFQEIDVYAKESGFVQKLNVDYGSHVKQGQVMATLEIPELQAQLQEDQADIKNASNQALRAEHEMNRYEAQYKSLHLEYTRLNDVFQSQPGIVAQQEVDDAQGKDMAAASQVDAGKAALEAAENQLTSARAKLAHDQALYNYSRIVAPFSGVVTERYANLGTLVQGGTTSTQALPIVKLSEDSLFRLVIPVPESYVQYIHVGDHVDVRVPSLNRTFPGKVSRFSVDVKEDTRTMHTEVDVQNPHRVLMPGLYAEADIALEHREDIPAIPLQAINHEGNKTTVYVVTQYGQIEDRPITLGLQTATDAEVVSGLNQGEQVVVSDRSGLKAGEKVHPQIVQVMQYQEAKSE